MKETSSPGPNPTGRLGGIPSDPTFSGWKPHKDIHGRPQWQATWGGTRAIITRVGPHHAIWTVYRQRGSGFRRGRSGCVRQGKMQAHETMAEMLRGDPRDITRADIDQCALAHIADGSRPTTKLVREACLRDLGHDLQGEALVAVYSVCDRLSARGDILNLNAGQPGMRALWVCSDHGEEE